MADEGKIATIRLSGQRRYAIEFLREKYPETEIVKDIRSGLNFKRKGLEAVLERAMRGDSLTLVVAHRDRLARVGIELIRQVIEQNGGEFVVFDETFRSPEEELTKDLLTILHVFSWRMPGLRNDKKPVHQALSNQGTTGSL